MAIDERSISIVGCGPGAADYLTPAAQAAIDQADILVGAQRLLGLFPSSRAERIVVDASIERVLDEIESRAALRNVTVLVTGDPGIFSLARLVIKRFGRERCRVIPGISSVQTAFARLGLDWADAKMISAHKSAQNLNSSILAADKIAVLLGREGSLRHVANQLAAGLSADRRVFLCENLTLANEIVREVKVAELSEIEPGPTALLLIIKSDLLS
jgi:cobalt-precorrin-7 (C5)-methyltransferase